MLVGDLHREEPRIVSDGRAKRTRGPWWRQGEQERRMRVLAQEAALWGAIRRFSAPGYARTYALREFGYKPGEHAGRMG